MCTPVTLEYLNRDYQSVLVLIDHNINDEKHNNHRDKYVLWVLKQAIIWNTN